MLFTVLALFFRKKLVIKGEEKLIPFPPTKRNKKKISNQSGLKIEDENY